MPADQRHSFVGRSARCRLKIRGVVKSTTVVHVSKSTMSNSIQRYNATAMQQTWITPDANLHVPTQQPALKIFKPVGNSVGHGVPR